MLLNCLQCHQNFKRSAKHNFCSQKCHIQNKKETNRLNIINNSKKNLPNNIPITYKLIMEYYKDKKLSFEPSRIFSYFGTIEIFCKECNLINGSKTKHYRNKEDLKKLLLEGYKKYGKISPTDLILNINKDNNCDIRGSIKELYGTFDKAIIDINIDYKNYYWTNDRIIQTLKELNQKFGPLYVNKIGQFRKQKLICGTKLIRDRFGSVYKAAELAGFSFVEPQEVGHK